MAVITIHINILFACYSPWDLRKRYHIFFYFLEFASAYFALVHPVFFIMVQIQNSNSKLHRSHLCAAAKMSHGSPDPTLLACIMINSYYHTFTGTPFHSLHHLSSKVREMIPLVSIPLHHFIPGK